MNPNILHITDLHIDDLSNSSGEYLKPLFYEDYLKSFCKKISDNVGKIHTLIITGDFIHQGKNSNFSHAQTIISFLQKELELEDQQIGLCIGNHDIDRDLDFSGDYMKARNNFYTFASRYFEFLDDVNFISTNRVKFKKISNEILFVSLDGTLERTHKSDKPGKISNNEIESIYSQFKRIEHSLPYKTIIIGSHYPLEYVECPDVPEESDWYEKHFWKSGEYLKRRLNGILKDIKVIWLSGDIHQPSFTQKENNLYIVSGRFGTADSMYNKNAKDTISVENISYVNRQATLIKIKSDHSAEVFIINHFHERHGFDATRVKWSISEIDKFELMQNQPEIISESMDVALKDAILTKKLFDYEKIVVDNFNNQVALGWVMIDRLLSHKTNMNIVKKEVSSWIKNKFDNINTTSNFLIVGLDFWGSIVASNLTIMLGIPNICIPSRGNVNFWSHKEHLDGHSDKFMKHLSGKKEILIIADVVGTGRTLKRTIDRLQSLSSDTLSFSCISLLCDTKQEKKENLNQCLKHFATCCGSFRLPIFSKNQLPAIELLNDKFILREES